MNESDDLEEIFENYLDSDDNSNDHVQAYDEIFQNDKPEVSSFAASSNPSCSKSNVAQTDDKTAEETPSEPQSEVLSQIPALLRLNTYKAGLDGLDVDRANRIIKIAGSRKGSRFYEHQEKRQKRIDGQIAELRQKADRLDEGRRKSALQKADNMLREMDGQRILNKVIVHFDMDMFFAACEIKANPELADKPMAVGSMAMISTSNYVARKFGVRSAMAGFIAKRLCPSLVLIHPHMSLYKKESDVIMSIIQQYDPNPSSASLDEVYIDLTDYLFQSYSTETATPLEELYALQELPDDIWEHSTMIVQQIRDQVFRESQLTVSAGISCNTTIAKICTDMNKPNGQFMVKGRKDEVMKFVAGLKLRKFPGVGPVRGQMFAGLDINSTDDIYAKRDLIVSLFSDLNSYDILRLYLGLGSTNLSNREEYIQKSHSREHTMGDTNKLKELTVLLQSLSEQLSRDLKRHGQIGRTITLKLKKSTFQVFLKSKTIPNYTDDDAIIFRIGKELLNNEHSTCPEQCYRLIGIKMSSLKDKQSSKNEQVTIEKLFAKKIDKKPVIKQDSKSEETLDKICRLCNERFASLEELNQHKGHCSGDFFHVEDSDQDSDSCVEESKIQNPPNNSSSVPSTSIEAQSPRKEQMKALNSASCESMVCPICNISLVFEDNASLNAHVDSCLNRSLCSELTRVQPSTSKPSSSGQQSVSSTSPGRKKGTKRKRTQHNETSSTNQLRGIDSYFGKA